MATLYSPSRALWITIRIRFADWRRRKGAGSGPQATGVTGRRADA